MNSRRQIAWAIALANLAPPMHARAVSIAWTPKSSTISITGASCLAGAGTGAIIGEGARKNDPYVDVAKNVAIYTAGGCALGLLLSFFVVDDSDDKKLSEENIALRNQILQKDSILAQHGLSSAGVAGPRSSMVPGGPSRKPASQEIDVSEPGGAKALLDIYGAIEVPYANIMKNAPKGMKIRNPRLTAFTIGYPGQPKKDVKESGWVSVSPRLGILPITGFLADTDILPPDPEFGYLADTFPWIECLILNSLKVRIEADKNVQVKFSECESLQ